METITNLTSQASKMVWGDGQERKEPVSGARGDVSSGEPYDAGNMDAPHQQRVEDRMRRGGNDDGEAAPVGADRDSTWERAHNPAQAQQVPPSGSVRHGDDGEAVDVRPSRAPTKDKAYDAALEQGIASSASTRPDPASENTPAMPCQDEPAPGQAAASPAAPHPGSSQPPEDSDAGPKPLETLAREHGGDAAKQDAGSRSGPGAGPVRGDAKGTGEQYVKTTGFAADGGDFDATKPGAGREADRLLEEKGAQSEAGGGGSHKNDRDKPSLGERIKHKLHKH